MPSGSDAKIMRDEGMAERDENGNVAGGFSLKCMLNRTGLRESDGVRA